MVNEIMSEPDKVTITAEELKRLYEHELFVESYYMTAACTFVRVHEPILFYFNKNKHKIDEKVRNKMIKKITKDMYPKIIWNTITEDGETIKERSHKRAKYVDIIFTVDAETCEKYLENRTELIGTWLAEDIMQDYDWGVDDIEELYRVEKKEVVVKKTEWVKVE